MDAHRPKLLTRVRAALRARHMSPRTEEAYVAWIRRFVHFHGTRHPDLMGTAEVNAFLTHLAVQKGVSATTQNQAASALLFLYRHVLERDLETPRDIIRARRGKRVPAVLTRDEVRRLLDHLDGRPRLVAALLYGSGLRLLEALTLRVKDVNLKTLELRVRSGKGDHDRVTMIPESVKEPLERQLPPPSLDRPDRPPGPVPPSPPIPPPTGPPNAATRAAETPSMRPRSDPNDLVARDGTAPYRWLKPPRRMTPFTSAGAGATGWRNPDQR